MERADTVRTRTEGLRLTERQVATTAAPSQKTSILYDHQLPGFGLRTTAAGTKSFILNYRVRGRERRLTIGRYPTWSVQAARLEAQRLRREIDLGNDPLQQRKLYQSRPTVEDLCTRYIEEHLPRKRQSSQRNDLAFIRNWILPALSSTPVEEIAFADVDRLHRSLSKTPFQANRVMALLSKMLNLARRWDWSKQNVAAQVQRYAEQPRERYLSVPESKRLVRVLDQHQGELGSDAIKLILLTGARKTEVLGAKWEEFDFTLARWSKPSSRTKQNKIHHLPLNDSALALLRRMRETAESTFLFPGLYGNHQKDLRKAWRAICREAKIEGFRLHDLRHTHASILASAGASLPIIGALLGHSQPSTTARYAHLIDEALRRATNNLKSALEQE